ncbi:MAG: response regulator [Gammaproteobacteria bacterium]|nr:response regulator [Gammaproteobacteria bacterium]
MTDFSSLSFLIVDDVSAVREFMRQSLNHLGAVDVYEASNGQMAIEKYSSNFPDVVFLDIELPDTDGLSILKKIKAIKSDAFVVMISAYSSVDNVKSTIADGASGFIVKPFSPQKITTILKKYPR